MPLTAPTYPPVLTKSSWDKKKGLLAKAAGATGVGEAAQKSERSFAKIDWKIFDADLVIPMGTDSKVGIALEAMKSDITADYNKQVKPVVADLLDLKKKAEAAAVEFRGSKTITKDSVKAAEAVATEAESFAAALVLNGSVMSGVWKAFDRRAKEYDDGLKMKAAIMKRTAVYLADLLKGLAALKANPTADVWDAQVKQAGRSVSNNLKGNPELKGHLDTWVAKFKGFDLGTMGFASLGPEEQKKAFAKTTADVIVAARALKADLDRLGG